jgi:hypothetical protein
MYQHKRGVVLKEVDEKHVVCGWCSEVVGKPGELTPRIVDWVINEDTRHIVEHYKPQRAKSHDFTVPTIGCTECFRMYSTVKKSKIYLS